MLASIITIYLLAFLQPIFHPFDKNRIGWLIGVLPLILFLYFNSIGQEPLPIKEHYPWVPSLGINLTFQLDGLGLIFALLILGIGSLIMIYAGSYLKNDKELNRFYSFILIFMGSMLGLVLADNIILAFVFWELTTISSYLLIGYHHELEGARASAQKALVVTTFGGLALLVGILMIGDLSGSFLLSEMMLQPELIQNHPHYTAILLLVALGAFAKSAQFPFHFWLPGAMAAPTPVSAYLHSATMVNAGIYLLARLSPLLSGSELWFYLLTGIGSLTMVLGAVISLFKRDLKLILAYSTISVLGMLVNLLGHGSQAAMTALLILLIAHALYKACLFMIAGAIDHEYHTRDITKLRALAPTSILLALAAGLAALSNAGLPPFIGFIAKEAFLDVQLSTPHWSIWLSIASVIASSFLFASALLVGFYPFWRGIRQLKNLQERARLGFTLGPLILAALSLWFALDPQGLIQRALAPAAKTLGVMQPMELHLFHGVNWPLLLSLLSFLFGGVLFATRVSHLGKIPHEEIIEMISPETLYKDSWSLLAKFARWQTKIMQNGYLRSYLIVTILSALAMAGYATFPFLSLERIHLMPEHLYDYAIVAVMILAVILALVVRKFLLAVLCLGVVGFGVVLLFALYSAPDLALTQLLVETLTLVLFVLMLKKLPHYSSHSSRITHIRDAVIATSFGTFITLLLWVSPHLKIFETISEYYTKNSLDLGHGANVVNVILVDFRALDTLGEITVLAVAGIGVFSLLKLKPQEEEEKP